jgi:hypothetical protein
MRCKRSEVNEYLLVCRYNSIITVVCYYGYSLLRCSSREFTTDISETKVDISFRFHIQRAVKRGWWKSRIVGHTEYIQRE